MAICKWCGETFSKNNNAEVYCCDEHRKYARQEQKLQYNRKYRRKYRDTMDEKQKLGLGSGRLSSHSYNNFEVEYNQIQKELKRLNLNIYRG